MNLLIFIFVLKNYWSSSLFYLWLSLTFLYKSNIKIKTCKAKNKPNKNKESNWKVHIMNDNYKFMPQKNN